MTTQILSKVKVEKLRKFMYDDTYRCDILIQVIKITEKPSATRARVRGITSKKSQVDDVNIKSESYEQ